MNDEIFKSLDNLVKATKNYYAQHPEHEAKESIDPALDAYTQAFALAQKVLKKYAPVEAMQKRTI